MSVLDLAAFGALYRARVTDVLQHWNPAMQLEVGAHNAGWKPGRYDFRIYLERSDARFHRAYATLARHGCRRVCDVGGMWGVLPLVLAELGFEVTMTEAQRYYSAAFDPLFGFLESRGVTIADYDPFDPDAPVPGTFDGLTALAIIEHYPHSLRTLMTNLVRLGGERGILYIEAPNVAWWPKRLGLLLHGISPLAPLEDIYESNVPFIGHHHEMTRGELRALARLAGLDVLEEDAFEYTDPFSWGRFLRHPVRYAVPALVDTARECLSMTCRRATNG